MKVYVLATVLAILGVSSAVLIAPQTANDIPMAEDGVNDSSNWTIENVAFFGGSSPPALAIDSTNRPIILYCPPGQVWLTVRENEGWKGELVAETYAGGVCGKLSLGPYDEPHITFPPRFGDPGQMYAVKRNGSWKTMPVPFPVSSLVVDRSGIPHIATARTFQNGTHLLYAHLEAGSWIHEYIEFLGGSYSGSHWTSMVLDSSNDPHILYYADAIGEVRYAYKENGTWKIEVVDVIGNIRYVGRHGSLALDTLGRPHAAYVANVSYPDNRASLRYALKTLSGWQVQTVKGPPGMKGRFASMGVDEGGTVHFASIDWFILNPSNYSFLADLNYSRLAQGVWSWETVYAGYQFGNDPMNRYDDIVNTPDFSTMRVDACGNPHIVFALQNLTDPGIKYATKGECPPEPESEPSVSLDVDPNTLNLKSRGRRITAYLSAENASVYDIDISSILLQDTLVPERWDYQGDVLMLKFNRQEFKDTVEVGESVEIKMSGKWKDGSGFEAFDTIRVIKSGKGR